MVLKKRGGKGADSSQVECGAAKSLYLFSQSSRQQRRKNGFTKLKRI